MLKIHNLFRILSVLSACLCINVAECYSQSTSISGTITDAKGHPLENAHVILNQGEHFDISNQNGQFSIQHLEPGRYTLTVRFLGYYPFNQSISIAKEGVENFSIDLKKQIYQLRQMVVTATRTRKMMENVPLPVTVIQGESIESSGSMRLSDILAQQTGLRLVQNHGTGLQIQGFSPEYTLIMINGQPIIGRRAGTLDLDRISVGNVKRIEIIKGPSSALWGSRALAGVVNIITENAQQPFSLELDTRYGTHQTVDLGARLSWQLDEWHNTFFINRYSTKGYSLFKNSISQTVPEHQNLTLSYRTDYSFSDDLKFNFYGRFYQGVKDIKSYLGDIDSPRLLNIDETTRNFSLNPSVRYEVTENLTLEANYFISGYRNKRDLRYQKGDSLYDASLFDQTLHKWETQATQRWNPDHITILGAGITREALNSYRYENPPALQNMYIYGQHDWQLNDDINLIAGFRFDNHNTYGSQFSPKVSFQYKATDWLHLRASTGRGFRAPNFSHLFLSFTNPTVGYTVLGSTNVKERIKELKQAGKIDQVLRDVSQIDPIQAEHSWAFNAGFDLIPTQKLRLKVNFFYNRVTDLIESAPIARKTNGQNVFSYFNLHKVYTRGLETQVFWRPLNNLKLSLGYQYLNAERLIEGTKTVQDDQGNPIEKEFSYYKPMFNRSKHSGTFKIFYTYVPLDLEANVIGTYHGRYGFADSNGNGYVDEGEYVDGYMVWDLSVSKTFSDQYTLQAGIDNIFNFTSPQRISYLSGRLFYLQLSVNI